MDYTWKTSTEAGIWAAEWLKITTWLREHVDNLDIPITKAPETKWGVGDNGKGTELLKLIDSHYDSTNPVQVFSEEMGLKETNVACKIAGEYGWREFEIDRACEILGIPRKDRDLYFNQTKTFKKSRKLKELMVERYGTWYPTGKLAAEMDVPVPYLRNRLNGYVKWGEYKQQVCEILGIKPEEEAEYFCDEKV